MHTKTIAIKKASRKDKVVWGVHDKIFVARRGYRDACSEMQPEASPTSDRTSAAHGEAAVPWRPTRISRGAKSNLQSLEEPTMERVDAQWRLQTFGKPTLEQVLAGPVEEWREQLMLEQVCGQDLGDPCRSSLFLKDCTPWKGPKLKQFVKNCSPEF